jgi:hypothetical protein
MPAGRADGIRGGHDARAHDLALVDRLAQPDVVPVVGAHVAHGGEAGGERALRVRNREHRPEAVVELEPRVAAVGGIAVQVHVHVDQARQQRVALELDRRRALGRGDRVALALHFGDAAVAHDDHGLVDIGAGAHVEQAVGGDDDRLGGSEAGEDEGEGEGEAV